jgi:hypothetical protein
MFKKRTRPASVRKANLEGDDTPASEVSSGAATPTAEGCVQVSQLPVRFELTPGNPSRR